MSVRWRDLLFLALLECLVLGGVMAFQHSPGYMDADYYTLMGERVAHGTLTEPFLWNYLDDPQGLPHPGFTYWQPLAAFVAAAGLRLAGGNGFAAARWPFFLLALLVPPLTALLAFRLSHRRTLALMSGALAVFSGFYAPYLAVPDAFTLLLVLGALFFLVVSRLEESSREGALAPREKFILLASLGLLAGAIHLTRAEGFLWLLAAWGVLVLCRCHKVRDFLSVLLGYVVVMLPWFLRNLAAFGAVLAPGGLRTLWLRNYDEIFVFPATQLTFAHWWAVGPGALAKARLAAAGTNLLSALAVQGGIVWLPFVLLGLWKLRRSRLIAAGAAMWAVLWAVMSLVFPFSGARGGFFHAGAAVQPLLWAVAPVGFVSALRPLARWRGWKPVQAERALGWGLVVVVGLLTLGVVQRRVVGPVPALSNWDDPARAARRLGRGLNALGVPGDALVLVNNPPGFTLATGHPTLVVPDGGSDMVAAVARRYSARYWVLEADHPRPLNLFYCHPQAVPPPWRFLGMADRYTPVFVLEGTP